MRRNALHVAPLALLLTSAPVWAVDLPAGATQQIDEIARRRVPVLPLPSTPDFGLRLQAPEKSAVPKSVDDLVFEIKGINVDGNTLFSQAEIDRIFAAAIGPAVGLDALRTAAENLETRFRERGYFLTRVFVPPQQVKDGVFQVQVIEGFLSGVYVDGAPNDALRRRIEKFAAPLLNKRPIDLASIERALLLINDLPGVVGTSLLRQGADLGASEIVVTVAGLPDSHLVTFNNTGSNTVGPQTIGINSSFNNPFRSSGALSIGLTAGGNILDPNELQAFNTRYSWPVGSRGMILSLGGLASNAQPMGSLSSLKIRAVSESVSPRLRVPLLRTRPNSVYLDLGIAVNRSRTILDGGLLTFDKTTVGEATLSWAQNGWRNGTTNIGISVFNALPLFDRSREGAANVTQTDFNDRFLKVGVNILRIQQLPIKGVSMLVSANGQWSRDKLPSGELVSFGGVSVGRGYDGGAITGERGFGGLLELRYDSPVKWDPYIGNIQFYAFVDGAQTYTLGSANSTASAANLSSNGGGMRFPFGSRGFLDLQIANAHNTYGTAADRRDNPRLLFSGMLRF
jgi:hemolysin activation/secretion protein